jgi:hypothetical protein
LKKCSYYGTNTTVHQYWLTPVEYKLTLHTVAVLGDNSVKR